MSTLALTLTDDGVGDLEVRAISARVRRVVLASSLMSMPKWPTNSGWSAVLLTSTLMIASCA